MCAANRKLVLILKTAIVFSFITVATFVSLAVNNQFQWSPLDYAPSQESHHPVALEARQYYTQDKRTDGVKLEESHRNNAEGFGTSEPAARGKENDAFWLHADPLGNNDNRSTPVAPGCDQGSRGLQVAENACCKRRNNIAFFKMHKCGSSTVQNIVMRYGDRYDLDIVLPRHGTNYLGQGYFHEMFIEPFPVKEYNIIAHHTRFSKEGFHSVMSSDALYVTIIRDPVSMFESTFTYNNYPDRYMISGPNALNKFLITPYQYYFNFDGQDHAKDPMLFDLGLENYKKTMEGAVQQKILQVASDFDLVMIMEYFPESLILLKHLMCWDFEDISYFRLNARSKRHVQTVADSTAEKIRKWNAGDVKLYEHFNRTFWEKVRAFGEDRMRAEVEKLEQMNDRMQERCVETVVVNEPGVWHPQGIAIESFRVKESAANDMDCVRMTKTEIPFTNYLRNKQLAKYYLHKERKRKPHEFIHSFKH